MDTTTALAYVIPLHVASKIDEIRSKRDSAYKRWPPHINFVFPFLPEGKFFDVQDTLPVSSFEIHLNKISFFSQGKSSVTIHIEPDEKSTQSLQQVYSTLMENVEIAKVEKKREFHPHLTIAQCPKSKKDQLMKELQEWLGQGFKVQVNSLHLLKRTPESHDRMIVKKEIHLRQCNDPKIHFSNTAYVIPLSKTLGYHFHVKLPLIPSREAKLVFCVDVSGSMSGAPINQVNKILTDIHQVQVAKESALILTYSDSCKQSNLQDYLRFPPLAGGMTYFAEVFKNMLQLVTASKKEDTCFIFMTDGQDTSGDKRALENSMQLLESACKITDCKVSIHVLAFTSQPEAAFLEQVTKIGNAPGTFRYANNLNALEAKFMDLFSLTSNSRECEIEYKFKDSKETKRHSVRGTRPQDEKFYEIETIIPSALDSFSSDTLPFESCQIRVDQKSYEFEVKRYVKESSLMRMKALQHITPQHESEVREIMELIAKIRTKGSNALERIEMERLRKERNETLEMYLHAFNLQKQGKLTSDLALKMNELRHEAEFSKARRKRIVELRTNANLNIIQTMDEKLEHLLTEITDVEKKEMETLSNQWECTLSLSTLSDVMQSPDDLLCWGFLIRRGEAAIDSPNTEIYLVQPSYTIISYNTFIESMVLATQEKGAKKAHGGFSLKKEEEEEEEAFCTVGKHQEPMNVCIPFYIHPCHAKRALTLKNNWLGYFFTLDSLCYDKNQDVGLITFLGSIIAMVGEKREHQNDRMKEYVLDLCRLCNEIQHTPQFKEAFSNDKYENFIHTVHGRQRQLIQNLLTPLSVAFLHDIKENKISELKRLLFPLYCESLKRWVRDVYSGRKVDAHRICKELMYGKGKEEDEKEEKKSNISHESQIEEAYLTYFWDPQTIVPPSLIKQEDAKKFQKIDLVSSTQQVKGIIDSLHFSFPPYFVNFLRGACFFLGKETQTQSLFDEIERFTHPTTEEEYECLRRHLLLSYYYHNEYPSETVDETNILQTIDKRFRDEDMNQSKNRIRDEFEQDVANVIANTNKIDAFAGMVRYYCTTRSTIVFQKLVENLIRVQDKEKLIALLSNKIHDEFVILEGVLKDMVWQPLGDQMPQIRAILGKDAIQAIEKEHIKAQRWTGHLYRESDKPNSHGHCNSHPWAGHKYLFQRYVY